MSHRVRRATLLTLAFAAVALTMHAAALSAEVFDPQRGVLLRGTVVTMDDAATVIPNGNVLVRGDRIVAVWSGATPPAGVTVGNPIVVSGGANALIFPGMINAHNHTAYNMLPLWPAPSAHKQASQGRTTGLEPYDNRYQWTDPVEYARLVNGPKKALTEAKYLNLDVEVVKYAEVKAMLGGETAFQGTPSLSSTNTILVRNIENGCFGRDRISQRGLSIDDTRWTATLGTGLLADMRAGRIDAWIVHLAEGVRDGDRRGSSFSSRGEFHRLKALGLLNDTSVLIHGTGLEPEDFLDMRQAPSIRDDHVGDGLGAKLVWSPLSNLLLYGRTTKVYHALSHGVVVALATDWSPSGSKNLLGELKIADVALRDPRILGNDRAIVPELSPSGNPGGAVAAERALDLVLVRMVTSSPMKALRWQNDAGTIQAGKFADIFMIGKPLGSPTNGMPDSPYRSLIDATERDVRLVMVGGDPVAGDVEVMNLVKPGDNEVVLSARGSFAKAIDITRSGVTLGDQTFAYVERSLQDGLHALGGDNPPVGGGPGPVNNTFSYFKARFRDSAALTDAQFRSTIMVPGFKTVGGANGPINLERMALDPVLVEDDDFFFHLVAGETVSGTSIPDDPTPPFKLYPANGNHLVAGISPFNAASLEDRWYAYIGAQVPAPPPPPATTLDEVRRYLAAHPGNEVRTLTEDVGLSTDAAQDVIAALASTATTRDDLLSDPDIGLGATLLLEGRVAEWALTHPPLPNPPPPPTATSDVLTLAFVNDRGTALATLQAAGVATRAANGILARRAGPDATLNTSDDIPFTTIQQVDDIAYVGPATIQALRLAAASFTPTAPPPPPVSDEAALLIFVNAESTTVALLTTPVTGGGAGVNSTVARAITGRRDGPDGRFGTGDDRPFASVAEVDAISGVGPATLQALVNCAKRPSAPPPVPKIVQALNLKVGGVYCMDAAAIKARIGLTITQANAIVAARAAKPGGVFASLAEIDAVFGIGPAAMASLDAFAAPLPAVVTTCP